MFPSLSPAQQQLFEKVIKNDAFHLAVQNAFNHMIITDTNGTILFANSAVERITGYSPAEVIGATPRLWGGVMEKDVYESLWHTIKDDKTPFVGEIINKRKSGEKYYAKTVISPILNDKGELLGFIGTEEDVTREKEAERMKSEFVSITAHQLRTPLTALRWGLSTLEGKDADPAQLELIRDLQAVNERLLKLVSTLLNIARIESGRLTVAPHSTDIIRLIEDVVKEMRCFADEKKQQLSLESEKLPHLPMDDNLVREVVKNLLSNAIKYTPQEGEITMRVRSDGINVRVDVEDTGIGIPHHEQAKIFTKFFRASNAKDSMKEGTGLGLYFIESIIRTCGGEMWFVSEEGRGSTFSFTLPLKGMSARKGEVTLTI
ncbi:MAG: ATP-binding protein [Candidatus Peribacteraceae bacterium]|nr:ATP-binding protein [Candidatus Peribacteraceae bacterium]